MRITLPSAFILLALASPILYAGTDPFVGPSIAIGGSVAQTTNNVDPSSNFNGSGDYGYHSWKRGVNSTSNSKNTVAPLLDFSWNWRLTPEWIAGAGVNAELGTRDGAQGTFGASRFDRGDLVSNTFYSSSVKMKQHYAIYGLIGRQLSDDWLLYGKVGYHQAKVDSTVQGSGDNGIPAFDVNDQQSFNIHGPSIGIGATYSLHNGLEISAETEYIKFNSFTQNFRDNQGNPGSITNKTSQARVNLMLGYRF